MHIKVNVYMCPKMFKLPWDSAVGIPLRTIVHGWGSVHVYAGLKVE